jgi:hypothetical protein
MRSHLLFLFLATGALSSLARADDATDAKSANAKPAENPQSEINPTDGSIIARLKMGPGFNVSETSGQPVYPTLGFDAGYRSFDGFGAVLTTTMFLSAHTIAIQSSAYFIGATPSYTFDHGDLSLSFGMGIGFMHFTRSDPDLAIVADANRLAFVPQVQGDYQLTRDLFVNLQIALFAQTGANGAFLLYPAAGLGVRF